MRKCVLLLALTTLFLCACGKPELPVETTLSVQPTEPMQTTVPQESTVPPETRPSETEPEQTQLPTEPRETAGTVTLRDEAPEYDISTPYYQVLPGQKNEYFQSTYIHTYESLGRDERYAYDGKYVYLCTEDSVGLRGNHYDAYVLYDGWMEKLENHSFRYSYVLYGRETVLEFDYALCGEDVLITWNPHEGIYNGSYGKVVDTSRGAHELLIRFELFPNEKNNDYICYFATLDLETSQLNYFLSQFDMEPFKGNTLSLCDWMPDGDLVLSGFGKLLYVDVQRAKVHRIGEAYGDSVYYHCTTEAGIVVSVRQDSCTFLLFDPDTGTEMEILRPGAVSFHREDSLVVYPAENGYHVVDFRSGTDTVLEGAAGYIDYRQSSVLYRDRENNHFVYDCLTGETVLVVWPEGYSSQSACVSPDGRKIACTGYGDNAMQIAVYDCDTKTLLQITRANTNLPEEGPWHWTTQDSIMFYTDHYGEDYKVDLILIKLK